MEPGRAGVESVLVERVRADGVPLAVTCMDLCLAVAWEDDGPDGRVVVPAS